MRALVLALVWLGGALAAGAGLLALYVLVVWLRLPEPAELPATGDPGPTAFMAEDTCSGHARSYTPLDRIDPRLICTVVWSEDWQFFHHDGIDRDALREALETNWNAHTFRIGASTITMQLARNLYLSRSRTVSRKTKELALARRLEDAWSKSRVLELYLNAAEWAPCVYGAEAAAQHYFGHGADEVDLAESTLLAAMLPRPARPPGQTPPDRSQLIQQQYRLLRRVSRARLMTSGEFRAAQRAILDGWQHGWGTRRSATAGPGWSSSLERACGTQPFRAR
ncbi:MAG TPA: biosynthetic peptidoglycan transglycosylase [Kofleriaceae bacterium]|nr:biosynthetic peptidoglycan transglycosylase [Kofleriaceae bacterium]